MSGVAGANLNGLFRPFVAAQKANAVSEVRTWFDSESVHRSAGIRSGQLAGRFAPPTFQSTPVAPRTLGLLGQPDRKAPIQGCVDFYFHATLMTNIWQDPGDCTGRTKKASPARFQSSKCFAYKLGIAFRRCHSWHGAAASSRNRHSRGSHLEKKPEPFFVLLGIFRSAPALTNCTVARTSTILCSCWKIGKFYASPVRENWLGDWIFKLVS